MKILICFFIGVLIVSKTTVFSQDVIIKRSGSEIQCKVTKVSSEIIEYKDYEDIDGHVKSINVFEVSKILYDDGKKQIFEIVMDGDGVNFDEYMVIKDVYDDIEENDDKETIETSRFAAATYFMLGPGIGASYGGNAGLRFQARTKGVVGFGLHAGGGYNAGAEVVGASAGIKFYPFKGFYLINTQFGIIGKEKYGKKDDVTYSKERILYGPSALTGVDWTFGDENNVGLNIAVGATYVMNTEYDNDIITAFDLGVFVKF